MHRILKETHKESNIRILKARDVLFEKARKLNNRGRRICLLAPIALSVIIMAITVVSHFLPNSQFFGSLSSFFENTSDYFVGIVTIAAFICDCIIVRYIDSYLARSNRLREAYDCKIFPLIENPFFYTEVDCDIKKDLEYAKYGHDKDSYEVWYRETFSDDDFRNAICLAMDNVIYTYYIYSDYRKRVMTKLSVYALIFIAYTVFYIVSSQSIAIRLIHPLILFAAVFDYIKELVSDCLTSKDLEETNRSLKETVINKYRDFFPSTQNSETVHADRVQILRSLQDVIIRNRDNSLFVPKSIRDKYIENGNPFYRELDQVKNLYWGGTNITKPTVAEDFEIPTVEDDNKTVTLKDVHEELMSMLIDVKRVLDEEGIEFMLDGGTLIGCVRESHHGFLPWDDDIDLAIKDSDVKKAIQIINDRLGDKYVVQDCNSETYYSPRLASFRVRQNNDVSFISEKDSELYELYQSRGLFLDVYSYHPVLAGITVDKLYRSIFIHSIYKQIRKTESNWKYKEVSEHRREHYLKRFSAQKNRFMRRVEWYRKHAKCTKYYSYIPGYVENTKNIKISYINGQDLYGAETKGYFEKSYFEGTDVDPEFHIPTTPEAVLSAFYGENWNKSPFYPLKCKELTTENGYQYSEDKFDASSYKHVKSVTIHRLAK